jgi:hypothetical protein
VLATAAVLWAVAVGGAVPPVAAHGGGAVFEVLEASGSAPGELVLRVRITHEADGDPAEGAIVDVVGEGPGGATAGPVRAERQDEPGVYAATLDTSAGGPWALAVTSSFPLGSTEVPVALDDAGTEVAADDAPADGSDDPVVGAPEAGGAEGGSDTANLVIAVVFGVTGGALGLWVSSRRAARRREAADHGGGEDA